MAKTFLVSDTHFGHENILKFEDSLGNRLRPKWNSISAMHEEMTDLWNQTVKPEDKVYHLGDVAIPRRGLEVLRWLNGRKILIKGNHDIFKPKDYLEHFDDIRAYWILDQCVLSHIPIHPDSLYRWKGNFHGHLHNNVLPDKKYCNVCVERTEFRPVDFEQVKQCFTV